MLNGYLKDVTNNKKIEIRTTAIKNKQELSYYLNDERYTLQIVSPEKLILNRITNEIDSILYFELNKVVPAVYTLKENNLSIPIDIRANQIQITDNHIKIAYTVIDSNIDYEYNIEMSE